MIESLKKLKLDPEIRTNIEKELVRVNAEISKCNVTPLIDFYVSETLIIIREFNNILNAPTTMSFMGKPTETNDDRKNELINEFITIANKYSDVRIESPVPTTPKCISCKKALEFDIVDDNNHICNHCNVEQGVCNTRSSFSDATRVNISSKYSYDRKIHFRECINQFQGKQNATIPPELITDLDVKFNFHDLLRGDISTPRKIRYAGITKKTIFTFLKELGYTKHYENATLIYSIITDTKIQDISDIQEQILADFDTLSELYDRRYADINRKNFINTQFVFFQLLSRHGHHCSKQDFNGLKTTERKFFHETIMRSLFEELCWNFKSSF